MLGTGGGNVCAVMQGGPRNHINFRYFWVTPPKFDSYCNYSVITVITQ